MRTYSAICEPQLLRSHTVGYRGRKDTVTTGDAHPASICSLPKNQCSLVKLHTDRHKKQFDQITSLFPPQPGDIFLTHPFLEHGVIAPIVSFRPSLNSQIRICPSALSGAAGPAGYIQCWFRWVPDFPWSCVSVWVDHRHTYLFSRMKMNNSASGGTAAGEVKQKCRPSDCGGVFRRLVSALYPRIEPVWGSRHRASPCRLPGPSGPLLMHFYYPISLTSSQTQTFYNYKSTYLAEFD